MLQSKAPLKRELRAVVVALEAVVSFFLVLQLCVSGIKR